MGPSTTLPASLIAFISFMLLKPSSHRSIFFIPLSYLVCLPQYLPSCLPSIQFSVLYCSTSCLSPPIFFFTIFFSFYHPRLLPSCPLSLRKSNLSLPPPPHLLPCFSHASALHSLLSTLFPSLLSHWLIIYNNYLMPAIRCCAVCLCLSGSLT